MEKEKKQKTLTTIAVTSDCVNKIDEYCSKYHIKGRKEFVELSAKYFSECGYDLNDTTIQGVSQIESVVGRLENICDLGNAPIALVNKFAEYLDKLNNNPQMLLPPAEREKQEMEYKLQLENEIANKERELENIKRQMAQMIKTVSFLKKSMTELIK